MSFKEICYNLYQEDGILPLIQNILYKYTFNDSSGLGFVFGGRAWNNQMNIAIKDYEENIIHGRWTDGLGHEKIARAFYPGNIDLCILSLGPEIFINVLNQLIGDLRNLKNLGLNIKII